MERSVLADRALETVLEGLVRVVRQMATAGGLSLPSAATLTRVVRDGPRRLTDLAAAEGVSQPGMTQIVTRLERDGLVQRTREPHDGRVVLIEATAAGTAVVQRRRAERRDALYALLDQLGPDDRDAVERGLPALGRLVEIALSTPTSVTPGARPGIRSGGNS